MSRDFQTNICIPMYDPALSFPLSIHFTVHAKNIASYPFPPIAKKETTKRDEKLPCYQQKIVVKF